MSDDYEGITLISGGERWIAYNGHIFKPGPDIEITITADTTRLKSALTDLAASLRKESA